MTSLWANRLGEKMKICKPRWHRWVEPRPWHQLISELVNTSLGFTPIVQFQLPYRWAEPSARPSSRTFETSQFEFFFLLDYIFWGKFMKILISSLSWTRYFKTLMRSVAISVAFVQSHEQIVCKLRGYDCRAQSCSFWTTWLKIEQSERLPKVSCLFKLKFFRSIFLGILSVSLLRKITSKYNLRARLVFWKSRLSRSAKKLFYSICSRVT